MGIERTQPVPSRHRWIAAAAVVLAFAGCELKGKPLTDYTGSSPAEPRLLWDGSNFVVSSLWVYPSLMADIVIVKYDANGNVVDTVSPAPASKPITDYTEATGLFSGLVWNPNDQQYALAYFQDESKAIWLLRLDASLKQLTYTRLDFPPSAYHGDYDFPTFFMEDLSLVWNTVKKEYAVSYTTRGCIDCHAQRPDGHPLNDVFLQRVGANGALLDPPGGRRIVACDPMCNRTSLAFDTETGNYAVAYFKFSGGVVGFLQPGMPIQERLVFPGISKFAQQEIRLVHDPLAHDYFVAASSTGGISARVVSASGALPPATFRALPVPLMDLSAFSTSTLPFLGPHRYMICASDGAVRCWGATDTLQTPTDLLYPAAAAAGQWEPSVVAGGVAAQLLYAPFVAWVEGGQIATGPYR